jgi:hypothetical protein
MLIFLAHVLLEMSYSIVLLASTYFDKPIALQSAKIDPIAKNTVELLGLNMLTGMAIPSLLIYLKGITYENASIIAGSCLAYHGLVLASTFVKIFKGDPTFGFDQRSFGLAPGTKVGYLVVLGLHGGLLAGFIHWFITAK